MATIPPPPPLIRNSAFPEMYDPKIRCKMFTGLSLLDENDSLDEQDNDDCIDDCIVDIRNNLTMINIPKRQLDTFKIVKKMSITPIRVNTYYLPIHMRRVNTPITISKVSNNATNVMNLLKFIKKK